MKNLTTFICAATMAAAVLIGCKSGPAPASKPIAQPENTPPRLFGINENVAHFPGIALGGHTNVISDDNVDLTYNGAHYQRSVTILNNLTNGIGTNLTTLLPSAVQAGQTNETFSSITNKLGTDPAGAKRSLLITNQFGVSLGDGVNVISTGVLAYWRVPYDMTIHGWELVSTVSGNIAVDVLEAPYDSFPPTSSIWGTVPTLNSTTTTNATGLSVLVTNGDWIAYSVSIPTNVTKVTLAIYGSPR